MKKLLVVDDDVTSLKSVQQALKGLYSLVLVKSGQEAITFLKVNTCDLVLLDYEMPIMNGVQVLEWIRKNPGTKELPVIFLTGNNESNDIKMALSFKPNGYILKPFNATELQKRLEEIVP